MTDFEEFEKQFEGVEDPGIFRHHGHEENHGREVFALLAGVVRLVTEDLVQAINLSGFGIMQYLRSDGTAVTSAITADGRTLLIKVELTADDGPFIRVANDDG